jgi:hypothetical protein
MDIFFKIFNIICIIGGCFLLFWVVFIVGPFLFGYGNKFIDWLLDKIF